MVLTTDLHLNLEPKINYYARASEQGNVIGLVSVCIYIYIYMSSKKIVIERTRDLIYLKFVATDFSPNIISPVLVKTPVTQRNPCYSAVSAVLMNLYQIVLIIRHFATPTTSLRINTSLVSSGQTLYQAASWRLILQSSLLQRFTAESSQELSALRKLNNKQRQVSMFLVLLFKLLTQLPFFFSLLPFSILSLLPLPHHFFLF